MSGLQHSLTLQLWDGRVSQNRMTDKLGFNGPSIRKVQSVYFKGPKQIMVEFESPEDLQVAQEITSWDLADQSIWSETALVVRFDGNDIICRTTGFSGAIQTTWYGHWELTLGRN